MENIRFMRTDLPFERSEELGDQIFLFASNYGARKKAENNLEVGAAGGTKPPPKRCHRERDKLVR